MPLPALDTFTEATNTPLSTHVADTGQSWASADIENFVVDATDEEVFVDGNTSAYLVATPAAADYYAEVSGKTSGTTALDRAGLWCRYVEGSAGYRLAIYGNDAWDFITPTGTVLAAGSITGSVGSFNAARYYTLRITVSGTNIVASINGFMVGNVTNAAYSAAGNPAIYLRGAGRITSLASTQTPPPSIAAVDSDNIITATQTGWTIAGTDFVHATVEIRQSAVTIAQTTDTQDRFSIACDTVFEAGAGPHLKYGLATVAVVNADDQEDTATITLAAPSGFSYVTIGALNPTASKRITAIPDLATGDQLEISNVVGGTIADVTVNADATFDCAASVTSFSVRCWDATDQTWGAAGTQTPGS